MTVSHKNTEARDVAVQFLYQCECEKLYYFSEVKFRQFVDHFMVPNDIEGYGRELVEGCLNFQNEADPIIEVHSTNWSMARMPIIDRLILRMAAFEISTQKVPVKVIINEGIELAKKYGTKDSAAFVNAILDKMAMEFS